MSDEVAPKSAGARELATAARNTVKLGLSLVVTWTLGIFLKFQVPRFLGPELFGEYNVSDNLASSFIAFLDLGVDIYLMKEVSTRPKVASDVFGGLLATRLALSVAVLGAMWAMLVFTHRPPEMVPGALIFGATYLVATLNATIATLLQASMRVDRLAVANVLSKLMYGLGFGVAIYTHGSLWVVAAPLLVAELLRTAMILPEARRTLNLEIRFDVRATKDALIASAPFFVNFLAYNLSGRLQPVALSYAANDPLENGYFGATQNIAFLASFVAPLLAPILLPLLTRARARSDAEFFVIVRRALEGLLVIMIPATLMVSLGADLWVRLAFGAKFTHAALSLRAYALDFIGLYVQMLLSMVLVAVGRSWSLTIVSLVSIPAKLLLMWLLVAPCLVHFGPGGGALGASVAEIITVVCGMVAYSWLLGRKMFDRRNVTATLKSVLNAVIVAVVHSYLERLGYLRIAIDVVLYLALAAVTRVVSIADAKAVLGLVKNRKRALPEEPAAPAA